MKDFLKKIILYNLWFPYFCETYIYKLFKTLSAKRAAVKYGNPSQGMFIVGVTGTDGKTTTCTLIHKIINDNIGKALLVSTATIRIGDKEMDNHFHFTSLEPAQLQSLLATAKSEGCTYAVLEVSSQGIAQNRFAGVDFDMAILTNITSEHLDYHKTFEAYANTKKSFFQGVLKNKKRVKYAVFPKDDESGRQWEEDMNFDKFLSFSLAASSSVKGENIQLSSTGTVFSVSYLGTTYTTSMPLLGRYNVYNALAAFCAGLLLGVDPHKITLSLQSTKGVSGRMQKITHDGVNYFVDFAHTPNALESALSFMRSITTGRVIVVFGTTGKKDFYKRPLMGRIAHDKADIVIVTDDDTYDEDRVSIISQIVVGIPRNEGENFFILPEREFALKMAVDLARPGDNVLIAGKGHELKQYTKYGTRPRNDTIKLKEILKDHRS